MSHYERKRHTVDDDGHDMEESDRALDGGYTPIWQSESEDNPVQIDARQLLKPMTGSEELSVDLVLIGSEPALYILTRSRGLPPQGDLSGPNDERRLSWGTFSSLQTLSGVFEGILWPCASIIGIIALLAESILVENWPSV